MYYLRTRPAVDAIKFTVDAAALVPTTVQKPPMAAPAPVPAPAPAPVSVPAPAPAVVEVSTALDTSKMTPEEFEEAKLLCSRANPEACLMCSG